MPTTAQQTYSINRLIPVHRPEKEIEINVALATGTYAKGTVLGEITASPGTYSAYASGNTDGTQVAKAILQYGCTVDGSGNISMGGDFGATKKAAPVFVGGGAIFRCADLVGLDATALTGLGAVLVEGNTTTGMVRF